MATALRWGILGTGAIARKFAEGVPLCQHGSVVAVGSRSLEVAEAFAEQFGGTPYGTYEEVLSDPNVEAVYIALPHHLHCEWTIKAAEAGKHILCEKPFTLNLREAKQALDAVKKADVFFMEAFMYRVHPQTLEVRKLLKDGTIGKPLMVHADFCYATSRKGPHFRADASVGGGALMDVGCYPVSFIRMVAEQEPQKLIYTAHLSDEGYDAHGAGLMEFPNGLRGTFHTSVHMQSQNMATIYGEYGSIIVTSPWFCDGQVVVQLNGRAPEEIKIKRPPHLWGNQSIVVAQLLDKKQVPFMSWNDTLGNMMVLDQMRKSAGMKFPADESR
ncbi:MAG: Gfo/Idh/MocA family oxidoreductase [Armatimonadetes bacterium]|nr:Gfo/Idh/MocA family oxidoreductase [Armatimonadota bacterium]